ncbi:MAG TPA: TlpA disulfide reductase family protein [Bryobacteraceae bacterium]|jgi:peroxiredoxin|nr:TlpA disulfide reductase family protein [Bryobacteraceae bacterium]
MASAHDRKLLAQGARAADFRLPRLDGGESTLADTLSRGPAVLAFYKVSCPVCQLALPYLERIQASGRLPIFAISQNDAEDSRDFNQRFGVTMPTLLDAEKSGFPVSNAFGISSVPTLFLVEPDGSVARVIEGWNKSEIEKLGAQAGVNPFREGDSAPDWKAG